MSWPKGKKNPSVSEYMKKRTGKNNPMYGRVLPHLIGDKNPNQNPENRKKQSERMKGENHWNWKGGISFFPYPLEWNKEIKQFIKNRDGNECQNPYCNHKTKRLDVHHINYDKKNCSQFNLITLCRSCNFKANVNRKEWERFYKRIIWSKY